MLRDFRDSGETISVRTELEAIKELFHDKSELEAKIVQDIVNFEDRHNVIIDKVRFQRMITRYPRTIYTELTLLLE